ncbi:farnesol dehydrogenase-like [Diorhabda sublineata]|uniref:farnesol dehydrogenase-like n=1 Tax=Diorhabda sublineata TaxID=1163346 RepID=UPI0024E0A73A|nr:farnesol dehydrogenase-like [Diorhabda sublineata]
MVLSMKRWVGKVAIVTGASSGIGAAITKQLVEEGLLVVGVARRVERIENLSKILENKPGKLFAFKADLSIEDEIKEIFIWTTNNVGPVSILINNAGLHIRTGLVDGDTEAWKTTINVNLLGLCIATREAIKIMRNNDINGHIIHINSFLGHKVVDIPNLDVYPASKYGVTALTETLRLELNSLKSKIKVTSISPGMVDTEIFDSVRHTKEFKDNIQKNMLQPEDIADGVIYTLSTAPHVQVHELTIKPIGEKF